MTPEQQAAMDVVRREFGEPDSTRFPETWGPRVVVEASIGSTTVFVKATGDADVFAEAATIGLARSAGVPAAGLLASGTH